jgi:raffinose/stachyose/melibiose transport system substrate-binding protein
MKKILTLILSAAMAVSMLGACGKQPAAAGGEAGGADAASAKATEVSSDDKTISLWDIATDEPDKTIWTWSVDKYNKEDSKTSGYTVKQVATVNDQYKQKLSVAMSAGKCPDVYLNWTGGPLKEYVKSGYAQDITDLVDKYGLRDKYNEAALEQTMIDGKIYALPIKNQSVAVFFYDKKMWKDKGYEVPKTLDDLEALCDKMVADGITPFALANSSQWTGSMYYCYLVARYGGPQIITDAYDQKGSLVNDATKFAGEKIEDWVKKGYFPESVNSLSPDDGEDRALLYKGAGMMLHGSWQVASIKQENPEFYKNLGAFAFPTLPDSKADQTTVLGTLGDNFLSFNCTGKKLEEAVKMAAYYASDEWMKLDVENGNLPPLKNAKSEEPAWQDIMEMINNASGVQLWWDQYLPASVAEVHKSASQKLFDNSESPEDVAKEQQDALDEYFSENGGDASTQS